MLSIWKDTKSYLRGNLGSTLYLMVKHWKLKHETKNVHPWEISFPQWISLERMLYPTILSKDCVPWLNMTCCFLKCIFCVLGTYTLMTQKLIWMFLYKKDTLMTLLSFWSLVYLHVPLCLLLAYALLMYF